MKFSTLGKLGTAGGLLVALTALALPITANAAVIDGAVIDISVTPTNPGIYDPVRATIDWCVPNGTAAGDTFTVDMPEQLTSFPPGFDLLAPGGELYFSNNRQGFKLDPEVQERTSVEEISKRTIPVDFRRHTPHRCWLLRKP